MEELEGVLREVARHVLGLPAEARGPVPSVKKVLQALPPNFKETLAIPSGRDGESAKTSPRATTAGEVVEIGSRPPAAQPDGEMQMPVHDRNLLRRLQLCEKKFQQKADAAAKLKARLEKVEWARQEAESAKGKAQQEAAELRKALSRVAEEESQLRAQLEETRQALHKAQAENATFQTAKAALEEQIRGQKRRVDELEARVRELESIAEQKKHLEAQLYRLKSFQQALPEPFPPEALLRVLVLDYPRLGGKAEERVIALIEGYQALLKGEGHPAFDHSNRELITGEPEGIVLLGLEKLLLDLASLPLARWLRTHAFRLEALLLEGRRPSSPRVREE